MTLDPKALDPEDATPKPSAASDIPDAIWAVADRAFFESALVADDAKCVEILARTILDALASAGAGDGWRPKVKPLDWHEWRGEVLGRAPYMIGYRIVPGEFTARLEGIGDFLSVDDAKAAAQADYDRRILSALDLPAAPPATSEMG